MRRQRIGWTLLGLWLIAAAVQLPAEGQSEEPAASGQVAGTIVIFNAGSLTLPLQAMEKEFERRNPAADVQLEAAGSSQCARKIIDIGKPCDVMASADCLVIDKLLVPDYADWNIRFATNQLVLCYTDRSTHADRVDAENWYGILQDPKVVWGHSDPNLDPCGYRALMVMQLAERHYELPGLYERLLANRPLANVRPKAVDLVSLLQTGNMDYAWEYISVAVQHGLEYVKLPDQINMGDYQYDDFYAQAVVEVTGSEPGKTTTMVGQSVTYGITLIKNAPNRSGAVAFLAYLLDPQGGLAILEEQGQPPFIPARVPSEAMLQSVPPELRPLLVVKK